MSVVKEVIGPIWIVEIKSLIHLMYGIRSLLSMDHTTVMQDN